MLRIPSIFSEKSAFGFLKSYGQFLKECFGGPALKAWAEEVGIPSRISFKHYTSGKRKMPGTVLKQIGKSLDFSASEMSSLEAPSLPKIAKPTEPHFYVDEEFFASPLPTILLNLCNINLPMSRPRIYEILKDAFPANEIDLSLERLLELKLIRTNARGSLERSFMGPITTIPGKKSLASRKYFQASYKLAEKSWDQPLENRELQAFTFRMNAADIPRMKDLVRQFRKEVTALSTDEKTNPIDSVFHCSLAVFPVHLEKTL